MMIDIFKESAVGIALILGVILLWYVMWMNRKTSNCLDLITSASGRYSIEKIGQCFGIMVAVTAPIYPTIHGEKPDAAVLAISLAYLGSIEAYRKYLVAKDGSKKP
tara:strand:- start:140 stop:457 length:318 start_codon:yes stop_codon:yes gene_type:complete